MPVRALSACFLYCADCETPLDGKALRRLRSLLGCRGSSLPAGGIHFRVFPRAGTISAWSSKATDILHASGLTGIRRIERGRHYVLDCPSLDNDQRAVAVDALHDRMLEQIYPLEDSALAILFENTPPRPLKIIEPGADLFRSLTDANRDFAFGLSRQELDYLHDYYHRADRSPTDAELMMFAQVNSEHCRHHVFNAVWTIDGIRQKSTLFDMIRGTHRVSPEGVLVAYVDNAAVMEGSAGLRWQVDPVSRKYRYSADSLPVLMKVETHNHPTAISPFEGAATGVGGEIRDEVATGRGGRPKAGLCGFSVSSLRIPGAVRVWEGAENKPPGIASPLQVMIDAPLGAAAFNNEFGRVCLGGYFRTLEHFEGETWWGYHKPIMLAGGFGNLSGGHVRKKKIPPGSLIVVVGGPAMLIGLRGGSSSSQSGGDRGSADNFASVQRDNPEMQRRCQEVIEQCVALGARNPILAIHDVGAGGLSNAVPELISGGGAGGRFELRDIPSADDGMSPMEIWCNESQERYVVAIEEAALPLLTAICERERCPFGVIGRAVAGDHLDLDDRLSGSRVISIPLPALLSPLIRPRKDVAAKLPVRKRITTKGITVDEAARRVLLLPAVAAKTFLITIGDRTVGGLSVRDQMAGPHQVPVSDCAVCATDYVHYTGEAMAVGERAPVAMIDAPASARLAVAEALTNILSADVRKLSEVRLSANWMAACGDDEDDFALFSSVRAVGEELCPALGIAIPVGKDSLSMRTAWSGDARDTHCVKSPLSLIVSAFAPVRDVRHSWTSELKPDRNCPLFLFDLSGGNVHLGGSALAQAFNLEGGPCVDFGDPETFRRFFHFIAELRDRKLVQAYHDRSDGGLFITLCEMAFAGHCGLDIQLDPADGNDALSALFSEGTGVVVQLTSRGAGEMPVLLERYGLAGICASIGCAREDKVLHVAWGDEVWDWDLMELKRLWWDTSYRIQSLRDDAGCAKEELESVCDADARGLSATLTFDPGEAVAGVRSVSINGGALPEVAILREQGVNGHMEMAASFDRAGFSAVDVHMDDLLAGRVSLRRFHGLAACGGFSYGDVLGAGAGWAAGILYHDILSDEFSAFFSRDDTFTLGVCNGCQMLSRLRELIPGAAHFPKFGKNVSERFEARLCMVEIMDSPSLMFRGMAGSRLPVAVAHSEGKVIFEKASQSDAAPYVCLRYVDDCGVATMRYPANPNGSPQGITSFCSEDGRVTLMMPHPERLFRKVQYSWCPGDWGEHAPWLKVFCNARVWLDGNIA